MLNSPQYADLAPAQVWARELDLLRASGALHESLRAELSERAAQVLGARRPADHSRVTRNCRSTRRVLSGGRTWGTLSVIHGNADALRATDAHHDHRESAAGLSERSNGSGSRHPSGEARRSHRLCIRASDAHNANHGRRDGRPLGRCRRARLERRSSVPTRRALHGDRVRRHRRRHRRRVCRRWVRMPSCSSPAGSSSPSSSVAVPSTRVASS